MTTATIGIQGYFVGIFAARFIKALHYSPRKTVTLSLTFTYLSIRSAHISGANNIYGNHTNILSRYLLRGNCTLAKFLRLRSSRIIEHVSPNFLHKTAVQLDRDDQLCDFREVFGRHLLEFGHGNHLEPSGIMTPREIKWEKNDSRTWLITAVRFFI